MIRTIFQDDPGDCAYACLAMVLSRFGKNVDLATLKQRYGAPPEAVNLVELVSLCGDLGLRTRVLRLEPAHLSTLRQPTILHWGMDHFVVLERINRRTATINNPATGCSDVLFSELSRCFTGIAVELQPDGLVPENVGIDRLHFHHLLMNIPGGLWRLAGILAVSVLAQSGLLLFPIYLGLVLNFGITPGDTFNIIALTAVALVAVGTIAALKYFRATLLAAFVRDCDILLANFYNRLILSRAFSFYERKTPSYITAQFAVLRQIRTILGDGCLDSFVDAAILVLLLLAVSSISPLIGAVLLVFVAFYVIVIAVNTRARFVPLRRATLLASRESAILQENVRSIQAVKLNNITALRDTMWQTAYRRTTTAREALGRIQIRSEIFVDALLSSSRYLTLAAGAFTVLSNDLTLGAFFALALYVALVTVTMARLPNQLTRLADVETYLRDISLAIAEPVDLAMRSPTLQSPPCTPKTPNTTALPLVVSGLGVRHDRFAPHLFRNLSFKLNRGEIVAIAGKSGSGKSTLFKTILRLVEPDEGEVVWYDRPNNEVARGWLSHKVSAVMQDDQVFVGSILQNITCFAIAPDCDRVTRVCAICRLTNVIEGKKSGFNTQIYPGIETLSAGERQRLFLARALYRNTDVLMLDEFTANLDQSMEADIFSDLSRLGKTILMTAHRSTLIQRADRVINLD